MVKSGAPLVGARARFIREPYGVQRGSQMFDVVWAYHALYMARYSRKLGDRADAAYWLMIAANARLEARAIRIARARLARAA